MFQTTNGDQSADAVLRQYCRGEPPLAARLEAWQVELLSQPERLHALIDEFGSPLNLLESGLLQRNVTRLRSVADQRDLDLTVYFARKANKALAFIDEALAAHAGIDLASLAELQQCLDRGVPAARMILTAAIKERPLVELAIKHGVCIAIDNADEASLVHEIAGEHNAIANIALRISRFMHEGQPLESRFGIGVQDVQQFVDEQLLPDCNAPWFCLQGLQFHLDGCVGAQRVSALQQCLPLVEGLRAAGHPIGFVDMGGGLPMSYLDNSLQRGGCAGGDEQWDEFWLQQHQALLGKRSPITYRNHALGLTIEEGQVVGEANVYPTYQPQRNDQWLGEVLDASIGADSCETISEALRRLNLQLRCEPGRSLLDGCGLTVARVCFTKTHPEGHQLIGLSMNSTQCRTAHDDFLVDPLVVPAIEDEGVGLPCSGFLVGAYCMESELLTWRRLHFPRGIGRGDLVVWPNTAGYFMHFRESRSHQFPLAKNLLLRGDTAELDEVDQ